MDRRAFLSTGSAAALGCRLPVGTALSSCWPPRAPRPPQRRGERQGDAALNALFDKIFEQHVRRIARLRHLARPRQGRQGRTCAATFDPKPVPQAARRERRAQATRRSPRCSRAIDPASLSPAAALNREIVIYDLEQNARRYPTRSTSTASRAPT